MIKDISVVMIAKNGERTIRKTLQSLKDFDDVVVYDNGSTDETIKIAKEFSNVNLIKGDFLGFGKTKKKATQYAKNDWILILDADEVVDKELIETLKNEKLDEGYVYLLNFNAYYKDRQIKHCGWSNQKIKRLFNKKITNYNDNDVHEKIIDENLKNKILKGNVEHYSYHSIDEFVQKANVYARLFAKNNQGKKKSNPLKAFLNAIYSFNKTYFFKLGFLDGYVGLVVAFSHMVTNFYKYIMLYEANKKS
ncbi:glycosyltransferase, family 2 [Campylobacter blaseri]|uniref:Glycosyl transferase n=1 Tax=Campylobacter blaseri TaxID=2042961 RepID=A0A2P8QZQ6_9BACT|nr:glycosyltransferase family 2 protein [Campylobacter blaseri]PSM51722.1 glycosyl transferase [Campylobacter blaseri]PSM53513.1 glycosyl transferase [Campylobacter blaseri]QKF86320.1 glycosyltransferase, family 2 [Campylobacter blaseri]